MQTKTCKRCGQTLSEDEFYKAKNVCIYCYKRQQRLRKRIEDGRPIKTVGELVKELINLPSDAKIAVSDNITFYQPTIVEFIRETFSGNEKFDKDIYNNVVVII